MTAAGRPSPDAYRDFERDGWQRAAARYATSFGRVTGAYAAGVLDALALSRGQRLLDVACGPGILVGDALVRGLDVVGIDFAEGMVAEARRRHPAADLRQADAEQLPLGDAQFDGVAVNFGILHFTRPRRALAEAWRVLRPGGRVAFTVWASPEENRLQGEVFDAIAALGGPRPALPPPPEGLVTSSDACRRLLSEAGFEDVATHRHQRVIAFRDGDELLRVLEEGTVQTSATLAGLGCGERSELSRSLRSRLTSSHDRSLEIESVAWLATATRATV